MTSFYPAASVRTSTPLANQRMLFQVNNDQAAIQRLQLQLSTGRRFQRPSEDLSSAIKVLSAQRQQEFRAQTEINLKQANSVLTVTETNLAQTHGLLNQLRGVAVEAASNTLSADQRTALLNQVDGALIRLTEIANTKFGDQYLFAGSRVRTDPVRLNNDTVVFTANGEQLRTISDYNAVVTANVTAQEAFGVRSSEIIGTEDLNPSVERWTPLSDLNQGAGVRRGIISISSGLETVELDLANVHDLGEVVDRLSEVQLAGRQLVATLSDSGIDIEYADGLGGLLRISDVGAATTATDLGINNDALGSSPVNGEDLNPILKPTTRLSQLFSGSGLPSGESLRISQGGVDYVVNTNAMDTVEDLLNRIERTGARVTASIDPTGRFLQVQSYESGSTLSIGENGGQLASMLGLRTFHESTPLANLNNGQGILANPEGDDIIITRNDGTEMRIDLDGTQTVQDVIDRINNNSSNVDPLTRVTASLSTFGNGLVLTSAAGAQQIVVRNAGGSQSATALGLTGRQQSSATGSTNATGASEIVGSDPNAVEVDGMFSSILKLRRAIASEDFAAMEAIWTSMDRDLERLSIARGFVGSRQQEIQSRIEKSQDEFVLLKQTESDNLDTDLAGVISELTQRQAALTASLQLLGQTARTTLFDFL